MAYEKKYEIHEVLSIAAEWAQNPDDMDAYNRLEELKKDIIVRDYMPMGLKELCLRKAIIDIKSSNENDLPYGFSVKYEIAIFFDCLLAYAVNINADINDIFKDIDYYDLLWISGIANKILAYCEDDFQRLKDMANRMISFDNLNELINNIQLTSPDQINRLTNEIKMFTSGLSPESIKYLGQMAAANDPMLENIRNNVEDAAYNEVMRVSDTQE